MTEEFEELLSVGNLVSNEEKSVSINTVEPVSRDITATRLTENRNPFKMKQ